jgi:hypothetical protein
MHNKKEPISMKIQDPPEMYLETILVLSKKHHQVRSIDIVGSWTTKNQASASR